MSFPARANAPRSARASCAARCRATRGAKDRRRQRRWRGQRLEPHADGGVPAPDPAVQAAQVHDDVLAGRRRAGHRQCMRLGRAQRRCHGLSVGPVKLALRPRTRATCRRLPCATTARPCRPCGYACSKARPQADSAVPAQQLRLRLGANERLAAGCAEGWQHLFQRGASRDAGVLLHGQQRVLTTRGF